jgi:hypothetical protein
MFPSVIDPGRVIAIGLPLIPEILKKFTGSRKNNVFFFKIACYCYSDMTTT